jgi:gliding motility-associated-like protein
MNDGENFSEVKTKTIEISESVLLDIPTVFSPNEDTMNDVWKIQPLRDADNVRAMVRVFDQRGNLVFETDDLDNYWDGRRNGSSMPAEIYFYTIEVIAGAQHIRKQGTVTIVK